MEDIVKDMWVTHGIMRAMCQAKNRETKRRGENRWRNPATKGNKQREKDRQKERKRGGK